MKTKILSVIMAVVLVIGTLTGSLFTVNAATSGKYTYDISNNSATITMAINASGDVTIPSKLGGKPVREIGDFAFYDDGDITSLKISDSVRKLGMFSCCSKAKSISIGNGVTDIEYGAFAYSSNLKSMTIPKNVKKITGNIFFGCNNLEKIKVESGNKVYTAKGNCLIKKSSKELIAGTYKSVIPADGSVTKIGENAFRDYDKLKSIKIPEGVTAIDKCAFMGCYDLESISLPKSLKSIDYINFCNSSLKTVYYYGTKAQKKKIKIDNSGNYELTDSATWKYATKISLKTTAYTYDGKVKMPKVTVTDVGGKVLKENTDYTVSYGAGRKKIGKYSVTVKIKNKEYFGSKTLYFKINPKGTTVSKLTTPKAKQIKATWKKQAKNTTGYQIQYSTSKTFKSGNKTATIKKSGTTTKTLTGLKSNKTYYVRIRTYKTEGKTKYYSDWSKAKSVKTK